VYVAGMRIVVLRAHSMIDLVQRSASISSWIVSSSGNFGDDTHHGKIYISVFSTGPVCDRLAVFHALRKPVRRPL
jgi:hypothetical protein